MADNTLLKHFFGQGVELDPNDRFNLNRKSRSKRLREMHAILRHHHFLRGFSPVEFREMLEELGPSFVKIGQTLSTRSEILPEAYRDELAKLQTECDPLPYEEVEAALRDIYGARFEEIFDSLDPTPLGSASLAQVHKARLATGEVVAVKVQRPGVKATMAQDIDIMRVLARRLMRVMKNEQMVNLQDVVDEMWVTFLDETDFAIEAENLALFKKLNEKTVFVDCPKVYTSLCSEYVLVMEYVDGIPIAQHDRLVEAGYDLSEIGEKILDNYATQILDHGFFHADPHPGNIIIRDGQIVYIDLGIMGRLTPTERAGFGDMIEAVGIQNTAALKDALLAFAVTKDTAGIDHARFLADIDLVVAGYGSVDVNDLDIGMFLNDVIQLTRRSKITLPPSLTNVVRGVVTIEGTIEEFIPNENIVGIINDHLRKSSNAIDRTRDLLEESAISLYKASAGMVDASAHAGEMVKMLTRGQIKLNMEMLGSEAPMAALARIVNRLTLGIIIAGLFIGSSMFAEYGVGPYVMDVPVLSFLGFAGAFVLSVWVVVGILRS